MDTVATYHMTRMGPSGYKYIYYMDICQNCYREFGIPEHVDDLGIAKPEHEGICQHDRHAEGVNIQKLFELKPPLAMVHYLTGMGSREFIRRINRSGHRHSAGFGHLCSPTDKDKSAVWAAIEALGLDTKKIWAIDDFLNLYDQCKRKVSMRIIWTCARTWDLNGSIDLGPKTYKPAKEDTQ